MFSKMESKFCFLISQAVNDEIKNQSFCQSTDACDCRPTSILANLSFDKLFGK